MYIKVSLQQCKQNTLFKMDQIWNFLAKRIGYFGLHIIDFQHLTTNQFITTYWLCWVLAWKIRELLEVCLKLFLSSCAYPLIQTAWTWNGVKFAESPGRNAGNRLELHGASGPGWRQSNLAHRRIQQTWSTLATGR